MDVSPLTALPVTASGPSTASSTPPVQAQPVITPVQPAAHADTATPSTEDLAHAVNQVNDAFAQKGLNLYASFEKDKATGINVVKIVDRKTNETVNQIPIKEILAFARSLDQQQGARGKLVHATA